ncbi:ImmA/IrrE family metallo-endopeptidase [bacterium]|nr:ImmA/IrrE family metallo-endopeptidase [bacterium]
MTPQGTAQIMLDKIWGNRGFPVDPVLIAHEMGIKVIETKLEDEVFGGLIKTPGKDPVIVISETDSLSRKRFSCAHELGHYVNHAGKGDNSYEYVDLRSILSSGGNDKEEIYANQFAACLLMPIDEIKRHYKKTIPSFILAKYFSVSDDAISIRLKNLNLV